MEMSDLEDCVSFVCCMLGSQIGKSTSKDTILNGCLILNFEYLNPILL